MRKKIKIAVFGTAGAVVLGAGIWFGAGQLQKASVDVYPVRDLSESIWGQTTNLNGTITSNVTQEVRLQEKQIVSKVYVQEGQEVKEGDSLLSYDMTLVNLDLELEKLNKKQLEIKKKGLEQELARLEKDREKVKNTSASKKYKAESLTEGLRKWKPVKTAALDLPEGIAAQEEVQGEIENSEKTEGAPGAAETGQPQKPEPSDPGQQEGEEQKKPVYQVLPAQPEDYSMTMNPQSAQAGETVEVIVTPPEGFAVTGIFVLDEEKQEIQTQGENGIYTFSMPASQVTVKPLFEALPRKIEYQPAQNGTLEGNMLEAVPGEEVTVRAVPKEGYVTEGILVTGENGEEVEASQKEENQYTFLMPEQNVTVKAEFAEEKKMPSGVYARLYGDMSLEDPFPPEEEILIENAVPFGGIGTKEDPLRFLCTKSVLVQGAFLNHIAGYRGGEEKETEPLYCRLEVRSEDSVDGVLLAAMLLDGSAIQEKMEDSVWYRTKLGEVNLDEVMDSIPSEEGENEEEFSEEDFIFEEGMEGGFAEDLPGEIGEQVPDEEIIEGYSKEELDKAIQEKKKEISTAALDLKEADLKINKVEKQLSGETVKSTISGVVKEVGDPLKGEIDGEPFLVIESSGGVYVQGLADEYTRDQIQPGQILTGTAYESGTFFAAEVKEISPYPASNYSTDREVSYYPFTAYIAEGQGLKDNEGVTMEMAQQEEAAGGIFISKSFVRSSGGEDYVYIEGENHKLKKQPVKTGKIYYGSTIEIKSGLTEDDYLAVPYGKQVKEGSKAKRREIEDYYNLTY